jgi:PAS domain S-box-containing protein
LQPLKVKLPDRRLRFSVRGNELQRRLSNPDALLSILDNLPTSIVVKDADLNFVYSNRAHCNMIGMPEHELLGKSDKDFWPEEQASAFLQNDRSVMLTGEESIVEEQATNANGTTSVVLTHKTRLESSGNRSYLLCVNSDISTLRKRENHYRALTESVPLGIAQVDEDLNVHHANPLFKLFCGGSGSEYEQERVLRKLTESNPAFPSKSCKFEAEVQGIGSEPRTMMVMSSGWLELGETRKSATVSLIDITQMAELQRINAEVSRLNNDLALNMRSLKEAQDELVKRGRMEQLGQLTATVAHELRNPLGAVRTSAYLLQRKTKDAALGLETLIERINKGVTRCDNIITQLLDFSRNKQLSCQPGMLDEWLAGVVEEEARNLPSSLAIELQLGLDGQEVPFDPARLQRAVVNLVNNASEAMVGTADQPVLKAAGSPCITVSTFYKDGHVSLRVSDNGPGISADVLSRIREPLFTTKSFGTGLGLPAVEQIAIQHGGRLDVKSVVGQGSSFTIWLPMQILDGVVAA